MSKIFYLFPFLVFAVFAIIMVGTNNHQKFTESKAEEIIPYTAKKTNTESNKLN